ncbi:MAG: hypothetical protein ACOC1N_01365 [Bacillota bacterium]
MSTVQVSKNRLVMESITSRWWFIALIPIIYFFAPPYVQKTGYSLSSLPQYYEVIGVISENNFITYFSEYSPILNSLAIFMVMLLFIFRNKFAGFFSIFVGGLYTFQCIVQNTSYTEKYGLGIITASYLIFPVLVGLWIWEAFKKKNNFNKSMKINFWTTIAFLTAFFAFWNPIDSVTKMPDFNPVYIFTNGGSLMFCTMTPMILAMLFFFYPDINSAVLRITGLTGATIGLIQLLLHFVISFEINWWIGVIHIPVFALSLAAVIVSFKIDKIKNII